MKKSLAIACAALMLLTGCGSGGGSVVSEVPNGDMVIEQQNMDGIEWEEVFTTTRDDGIAVICEVKITTSCIGEEAYSVYKFEDPRNSVEFREKLAKSLEEGAKFYRWDRLKEDIQKDIDYMEKIYKNATNENEKELYFVQLSEFIEEYENAPEDYIEITDFSDPELSAMIRVDDKALGGINFRKNSMDIKEVFDQVDAANLNSEMDDYSVIAYNAGWFRYYQEGNYTVVENFTDEDALNSLNRYFESVGLPEVIEYPDNPLSVKIYTYDFLAHAYKNPYFIVADYIGGAIQPILELSMSPIKITFVSNNVALLSFEEVKNSVKTNFLKCGDVNLTKTNYITSMELSLYPVMNGDNGVYIPVWVVHINNTDMIINAIDGTLVDSIKTVR